MSVTTARIDMKDVYLYVLTHEAAWQTTDGSGLPDTIVSAGFKFAEGDFNYNAKKEYDFIPDRGKIETGSVRQQDEQPMEVNFQGEYETLFGDDDSPSAYEILVGTGDCVGFAGLGPNNCEPYATWLFLINDPLIRLPQCSEGEGLLFKNFFCNGPEVAIKAGTVSFQGKCKKTAPDKVAWNNAAAITGWTIPDIHIHD